MSEQKNNYKTPQRLAGFPDFFAKDMMLREKVINTFKRTFEKYGYEPLETPALEYSELILGQSGAEAEKQYYRFVDQGGRDVMLKFEVMISMCRALAQNINNVPLPYKRYQIQKVWRAEKVQKGRYREFTQCDADTIGSTSMRNDGEFIQMGLDIVDKLGFKNYIVKISNKKFLDGLAEYLNIPVEKRYGFQMSIDKLYKIGKEKVIAEMIEDRGISKEAANKALELIDPQNFDDVSFRNTVDAFQSTVGVTQVGKDGLSELLQILDYLELAGVNPKLYKFDTTIARGLASYTGPVWEYEIIEGGVGSIGGCGRYDNAIGKYLGYKVPATGGSFGIERICDIIKDREMWELEETPVSIMVCLFNDELFNETYKIASILRNSGFSTMLYPTADKLDKQFKYADKKGIPYVIVAGPDEISRGTVKLKDMRNKTQEELTIEQVVKKLKL
jgi:histidyl-tRNA synthetase